MAARGHLSERFQYRRRSLLTNEGLFKRQLRDCEFRRGETIGLKDRSWDFREGILPVTPLFFQLSSLSEASARNFSLLHRIQPGFDPEAVNLSLEVVDHSHFRDVLPGEDTLKTVDDEPGGFAFPRFKVGHRLEVADYGLKLLIRF